MNIEQSTERPSPTAADTTGTVGGNPPGGDPSFSAATTYCDHVIASPNAPCPINQPGISEPRAVAIGNLNADLYPDLAARARMPQALDARLSE